MWIKDYRLLISLNIINKDSDDIFKHGKTSWNEVCTSVSLQPYGKTTLLVVSKKWSILSQKFPWNNSFFDISSCIIGQLRAKKIGMLSKTWQTKLQTMMQLVSPPHNLKSRSVRRLGRLRLQGFRFWERAKARLIGHSVAQHVKDWIPRTKAWSRSTNSAFRPVVFSPSFFNSSLSSATCHADKRTKWQKKWIGHKESDKL